MGENVAQKLDKAIASINKGADKKEEMRLMMGPNTDWERYLTPAPATIAILGQLILISTYKDFSLQDKKESIKFKLLKYPDSFRASLVQVSNSGWVAFNKAHTCMDQVRLYSGNVDKHVKTAVKFLLNGSPEEVKLMVPKALESIGNIADECVMAATKVEEEFVFVMEMVSELLVACTRAQGQHQQDLKDVEIQKKVVEVHKKALDVEKKQAEENKERMMKEMKAAEDEYKDAMKSMPSTGDLVGLAFTDTLLGVARGITNMMSFKFGSGGDKTANKTQDNAENPNPNPRSSDNLDLFKLAPKLHELTKALVDLACGGKNDEGKACPKWNDIENSEEGAQFIKCSLENMVKYKLPAGQSKMKKEVEEIFNDAIKICDDLLSLKKRMKKTEKEIESVMSRAQELSSKVEVFHAASSSILNGNSLSNPPPQRSKQQSNQNSGEDGGLVKSALDSYRFKTETAKEMLKDTRGMYDKACDDLTKRSKEMAEILGELAKVDLEKIDHETILATLKKGIKAMGDLREQWSKLVQFFQMLSNLVKCSLNTSLKSFVETSQSQLMLTEAGCAMSNTMRDVIFEQAFQANQIAYVVNSISSVYVEVSDKYLMDRITCLGKLVALDPVNDAREIQLKRQELDEGCKEAQNAIKKIALEKKKQMSEAVEKRIGRIEAVVEAILPPISETEAKQIQNRVKTGIALGKATIEEEVDDWT